MEKIKNKFKSILGTGVLDIWLQRISYSIKPDIEFNESLCNIVANTQDINIWESDWITDNNFKNTCLSTSIINRETLAESDAEISEDEVALFPYDVEFPFEVKVTRKRA